MRRLIHVSASRSRCGHVDYYIGVAHFLLLVLQFILSKRTRACHANSSPPQTQYARARVYGQQFIRLYFVIVVQCDQSACHVTAIVKGHSFRLGKVSSHVTHDFRHDVIKSRDKFKLLKFSTARLVGSGLHKRARRARATAFPYKGREGGLSEPRARLVISQGSDRVTRTPPIIGTHLGETLESVSVSSCTRFSGFLTISSFGFNRLSSKLVSMFFGIVPMFVPKDFVSDCFVIVAQICANYGAHAHFGANLRDEAILNKIL